MFNFSKPPGEWHFSHSAALQGCSTASGGSLLQIRLLESSSRVCWTWFSAKKMPAVTFVLTYWQAIQVPPHF